MKKNKTYIVIAAIPLLKKGISLQRVTTQPSAQCALIFYRGYLCELVNNGYISQKSYDSLKNNQITIILR